VWDVEVYLCTILSAEKIKVSDQFLVLAALTQKIEPGNWVGLGARLGWMR
jgi:hypothetical protein